MLTRFSTLLVVLCLSALAAGCSKQSASDARDEAHRKAQFANHKEPPLVPVDELTIEYFADPNNIHDIYGTDECTVRSAQAIIQSGLPYPNYGKAEHVDAEGKPTGEYYDTVDYWLCGERYVFPKALAVGGMGYPMQSPHYYYKLAGTLPNLWPQGESAGVVDGMGPVVDIQIINSTDPRMVNSFHESKKNPVTIKSSVKKMTEFYQDKINGFISDRDVKMQKIGKRASINLNNREDLNMFELVYDYGFLGKRSAIGHKTEASYWPVNIEDQMVEKLTGGVKAIQCDSIHDKKKRYGDTGWSCGTGFNLSENSSMRFRMYVSHIKEFPNVFNQLQNMAFRAKQLGEQ